MNKFFGVIVILLLAAPCISHASTADMSISSSDIRFSKDTFVSGDTVRIYSKVRNTGDVDITGYVAFYSGSELIDSSQVATLVASGANEEVWVDYIIPYADSFNIRAVIKGTSPQDTNPSNDEVLTPLYSIITDDDGDGIDDSIDNCVGTNNASQDDYDNDGVGDACDDDDDNDRLSDEVEDELGTDEKDADTDDDGYNDANDEYPLDSTKHEKEDIVELILFEVEEEEVVSEVEDGNGDSDDSSDVDVVISNDEIVTDETLDSSDGEDDDVSVVQSSIIPFVSPNASFEYTRDAWKTYSFNSLVNQSTYIYLEWDFGDGSRSNSESVTHEFNSYGVYNIALRVTDHQGQVHEDIQEINISFFNLSNPFVIVLLGVICLLFAVSIVVIIKTDALKTEAPKAKAKNKIDAE